MLQLAAVEATDPASKAVKRYELVRFGKALLQGNSILTISTVALGRC
jgi:hypothetical protein